MLNGDGNENGNKINTGRSTFLCYGFAQVKCNLPDLM